MLSSKQKNHSVNQCVSSRGCFIMSKNLVIDLLMKEYDFKMLNSEPLKPDTLHLMRFYLLFSFC